MMMSTFQPAWLQTAELQPILQEIYRFTKEYGVPPSVSTLHEVFKKKDDAIYKARVKEVLDQLEALEPDISDTLYVIDQARDVAATRSFSDLIASPIFTDMKDQLDGRGQIREIEKWMRKFQKHSEEDLDYDFKEAYEHLVQAKAEMVLSGGAPRIQCGIDIVDQWSGGGLRPKNLAIALAPTGHGKCLAPETPVLTFEGDIIRADQVTPGMSLMGPDSKPRTVLSTTSGAGQLYRVTPVKGERWICNDRHILTLKNTTSGKILDIEVKDYLQKSRWFKHCHKLFSTGVVFKAQQALPLDPYFIGVWLGDGDKNLGTPTVTNINEEVIKYLKFFAKQNGLKLSQYPSKKYAYGIVGEKGKSNPVTLKMRVLFKNEIRIPKKYLTASESERLELLAGILDTDGYLKDNVYYFSQVRETLFNDILFLARSLGLKAIRNKSKFIRGKEYHCASISGHVNKIPCKIKYKKAHERKINKDALRTGFSIEDAGTGKYFGFELDGDGRFLLGDFTVTHNSQFLMAISHHMASQGHKVLFISNELSMEEVTERFVSRATGRKLDDIMEDPNVGGALDHRWRSGFHKNLKLVECLREMDSNEIEGLVSKYSFTQGWRPDIVVIDFMERMKPTVSGVKRDQSWNWFGYIAKDLVRMAKKNSWLIWTAGQTNRGGLDPNRMPSLADAQGSIQHLQEAALVITFRQNDMYPPERKDHIMLEMMLVKSRHSKKPSKSVLIEADFSRVHITNRVHEKEEFTEDKEEAGKFPTKKKDE